MLYSRNNLRIQSIESKGIYMSFSRVHNLKSLITAFLIAAFSLSLVSCTKEETGTLLGAIGGAAIGDAVGGRGHHGSGNTFAIIAGGLAGAYIGREIGRSLDKADREAMTQRTQYSLESTQSGSTSNWHNPDSGNSGTITPQPAYTNKTDQYCREYQQTITVGGKTETAYGTACRQPDGSWKITN